jgi:hypothetical protein
LTTDFSSSNMPTPSLNTPYRTPETGPQYHIHIYDY